VADQPQALPTEAAATALAGRLADADPAVRRAAGDALALFGAHGLARLKEGLAHETAEAREAAAGAIGRGALKDALGDVVAAFTDGAASVRLAAITSAAQLSGGGDGLKQVLVDDDDPDVRRAAAHALATVAPDGTEPALIAALGDEAVRQTALASLDTIGWVPDSAIGEAILAMARRDWAALVALGDTSVPLLERALSDRSPDKGSVLLRASMIEALGKIGSADATRAVEACLNDIGGPARAQATREIGRLHAHAARGTGAVLQALLRDDPQGRVRVGAATALGMMRYTAATDDLRTAAEGDTEPTVRLAAAEALAGIGETGLLVDQLKSTSHEVRRRAAVKLGELEAAEAIDPLIGALGDAYATVRAAAFEALRRIGWTPVGVKRDPDDPRYSRWMTRAEQEARTGITAADQGKMLASDLAADDPLVRQAALEALAMRHDPKLAALATPMLEDPVLQVREAAAETLQTLDAVPTDGAAGAAWKIAMRDMQGAAMMGEVAKPALLRVLRDNDSDDRAEAVRTLAMLGGEDAEDALITALVDPTPFVRVNAALSLGIAGGKRAVPALAPLLANDHSTVRTAVGRTLSTMGKSGLEALVAALSHDADVARAAAARALKTAGEDANAAAGKLMGLLAGDLSESVRVAAAEALAGMPGPYPTLSVAALRDDSWRVRQKAAAALGTTAPEGAAEVLVRCLGDSYSGVRTAALKALDQVGWKPEGDVGDAMVRLAQEDWRGLARVGPAAIDLLGQTLIEKGPDKIAVERRVRAIETVEAIGLEHSPPGLADALRPTLDDVAGPVRAVAARACGRLGLTELGPRLLEMAAEDPHEYAQVCAAAGLGRAGNDTMAEKLHEIATTAVSPNVRLAACRALAGPAVGDIALLIVALRAPEPEVRQAAAKDLGEIGNQQAIEPLIDTLGDAVAWVRAAARTSLEQLGWQPVGIKAEGAAGYRRWLTLREIGGDGDNAVDQGALLIEALTHALPEVRRGALEALGDRGEAACAKAILPLLDDVEQMVRREAGLTLQALKALPKSGHASAAALVALGRMSDAVALGKDAVPSLLRALAEHGPEDREAVVSALAGTADKGAITAVVGALADDVAAVRAAAVVSYADSAGEKGVDKLAALIADSDDRVRATCATTLAGLGKKGVEALKTALAEGDGDVRVAVIRAIGALEKPGPKLITAIAKRVRADTDADVRVAAIVVLTGAIGVNALDVLAERLREDESFLVREAAATAIGDVNPKGIAELLVPALGDEYSEVREAALTGLAASGWEPQDGVTRATLALAAQDFATLATIGADAAPLIVQMLTEKSSAPDAQKKRAEAVRCLGKIGGPVAEGAVLEGFEDPSARVRAAAADASAWLGLKAAADALIAALEGDSDYRARARAASAIGVLGLVEAAPVLSLAASQDDDPTVRSAAAIALAGPGIGDLERLIHQLGDSDANVRQEAALELGRLGNPRALDPLISALSDAYSPVRTAAKESLSKLDWVPFGARRTPQSKGYDRWVLRQELLPKDETTPQLDVLIGAINLPDPTLRRAVAEAFGLRGDKSAAKHLKQMLKDADPAVIEVAKAALDSL